MRSWIALLPLAVACASSPTAPKGEEETPPIPGQDDPGPLAVVDAVDRSEADRALDAGRRPTDLLNFIGVKKGMKVADLGAGGGYTTELLARAVGPNGVVYGQNNEFFLDKFAEKPWSERLEKPINKSVVRSNREFEDPLPPEAKDLDAVVFILVYHDTVWLKTDRAKMNKAVFEALKSGGKYVVVDHSAADGRGLEDVQTLHRIEQKVVREEILAAGFRIDGAAHFLENPADKRDWNDSPSVAKERRGTSDRFVLRFMKP